MCPLRPTRRRPARSSAHGGGSSRRWECSRPARRAGYRRSSALCDRVVSVPTTADWDPTPPAVTVLPARPGSDGGAVDEETKPAMLNCNLCRSSTNYRELITALHGVNKPLKNRVSTRSIDRSFKDQTREREVPALVSQRRSAGSTGVAQVA